MESLENGMKMLIVSSYPPRECGIATFTNDIFKAVKNVFGDSLRLEICALQNAHQQFDYPAEVSYILQKDSIENYRLIGEEINQRLPVVTHEPLDHIHHPFCGNVDGIFVRLLKVPDDARIV